MEVRQPSTSKQQRLALNRFFSNERHSNRDLEYAQEYNNVIQDYTPLDHAELLTPEQAKKELRRDGIYVILEL